MSLTLASGSGYTIGTTGAITGTITNDDFLFSINDITIITGNARNNRLDGGTGIDTLIGGAGNDTYVIDTTTDTLIEAANAGTDTIETNLTLNLASYTNIENLTLTGTANLNGTGNTLNNLLTGNSVNNIPTGGDGNDTLNGGTGNDTLIGGKGNDKYLIDNPSDVITENANEGTDTVQSTVTYTLGTTLENLILTGNSNINGTGNTGNNIITGNNGANTIAGNDGNDLLSGSNGNDTLTGGNGNDTLVGGLGNDSLTGGSGQDYFKFNAPNEAIDVIIDFSLTDDTIYVSRAGFSTSLVANAVLAADQFGVGAGATTAEQRFVYNSSTDALIFDANGNVSGGVTQIATLSTGLALTNADIFVTL